MKHFCFGTFAGSLGRLAVLVLCAIVTGDSGIAEDRRTDPTRLIVMTFNGEFLWDGIQPEEGSANYPWKGSPEDADEHMADVAEVIIQHNPDIVNMVEVESLVALQHFNQQHLAGRGYVAYLTKGKDSSTGQDVGLLTRIDPIGETIARYAKPGKIGNITKSVSKNYFAKFDVDGVKFALIGLHLLAQPGNQSALSTSRRRPVSIPSGEGASRYSCILPIRRSRSAVKGDYHGQNARSTRDQYRAERDPALHQTDHRRI